MKEFLVWFIHLHLDFRVPEFESLCATYDIEYELGDMERDSPFMVVKLPSDEAAMKVAQRGILIKGIYELWGDANDYPTLEDNIKKYLTTNEKQIAETCSGDWTFRLKVEGFGRKYSTAQQNEIMMHFSFMDILQGKVNLAKPDQVFWIIEEIGENQSKEVLPKRVMFTRQISLGSRSLIDKFNVKKRAYIGTTSMDSALSLIISNMAKAAPGKLVIDPFTGTGSLLITCCHFGCVAMGGDLDPRVIRGIGKGDKDVMSNFRQYGLVDKCGGLIINDNSKLTVWREGELFDAIVGDPPYGVRAGAKKVGKKKKKKEPKPIPEDCLEPHIPQCIPYAMV